jgi:hypothetical protein
MGKINYKLVVGVLVVGLILFFAGNYLFDNYQVNNVLSDNLIQVEGVEDVSINEVESGYEFSVTLSQIDDLRQTYIEIEEQIAKVVDAEYTVKFNSSLKASELESLVDLALYEASQTGKFIELGQRIRMYKTQYSLSRANVQIDEDYIYVNLVKEGDTMYKVINRQGNRKG